MKTVYSKQSEMRVAKSMRLLHAFGSRAKPFVFYSSIEMFDLRIASNLREIVVQNVKFLVSMALLYLSMNQIHQIRDPEETPTYILIRVPRRTCGTYWCKGLCESLGTILQA